MLSEQQKKDQLKAEISLHLLRALLPLGPELKGNIELCTKPLVALSKKDLAAEKMAAELNQILAEVGLKFAFLTDKNAKEYVMNNPNVFQIAGFSAQFLAWATTISGYFKDYGMNNLLLKLFKDVQAPQVSAKDGLLAIHQALGLAMLLQKFRREGLDTVPPSLKPNIDI